MQNAADTKPPIVDDRVEVPISARQAATRIGDLGRRMIDLLGRVWSTPMAIERAEDFLVEIATEALKLRAELIAFRKANTQHPGA